MTTRAEEEEELERQQQQLLNQISLLNRLIESQVKGEKITFDLDDPRVRNEIELLQDTIQKKLGKDKEQQQQELEEEK